MNISPKNKHSIFLAIVFLICMASYIFIEKFIPTHEIIKNITLQIGLAFFLALLLGETVERLNNNSSKEIYEKELSKLSLGFLTLFAKENNQKFHINDATLAGLLLGIAGESHYREDYCVTIENVNSDGYIDIYIRYKAINLLDNDDTRDFSLKYEAQKTAINFKSVRIESLSNETIFLADNKTKIKSLKSQKGGMVSFNKEYILPKNSGVIIESNIEHKSLVESDKNIKMNSSRITKDITIKIKSSIENEYRVILPTNPNLVKNKVIHESGYSIYNYRGYLLPQQSLEVRILDKK